MLATRQRDDQVEVIAQEQVAAPSGVPSVGLAYRLAPRFSASLRSRGEATMAAMGLADGTTHALYIANAGSGIVKS